jgi:hypothetical protein
MSSSNFEILKSLVKRVLDGKHTDAHHRLAYFMVYGSGHYTKCRRLVGDLQRVLGDSDRGLRLLDAQLEAEKLIACPALVK